MRYWIGVVMLLAGCQSTLPPVPVWQLEADEAAGETGRIVELRTGRQLEPGELVALLASQSRVLVGEKHDNPDHHALQQWLLRALRQERQQGSVLMEMLTPSQQAQVDQLRTRLQAGELIENLPRQLSWQSGWSWSLYGPLVTEQLLQGEPLLAANLDRREVMDIYQQAPSLPAGHSTAPVVQNALREDIRRSHCDLLPESQVPAMLAVQQQRDRRMAEQLRQAPLPALLLAGGFHVRKDLGVPLHLQDLAEPAPTVLMLSEVGQAVTQMQADYVWFTPATAPQDYCAILRK